MKQLCRILGVFCIFCALLSVHGFAAHAEIDVSTAHDGFFSVFCEEHPTTKMKLGVTTAGQTTFYDYVPGTKAVFAFDKGDGDYAIVLYRHHSGTSYRKVLTKPVSVRLTDPLAPYLVSTTEITFSQEDAVGQKAAALCEGLSDAQSKMVAIYNDMAASFQYDEVFADAVRKGMVRKYTPNTNQTMNSKLGVCYDFSALFAAMCRSQGIPCALVKGNTSMGYHAWNLVYVDGVWTAVDVTTAVIYRAHALSLADCIAPPQ